MKHKKFDKPWFGYKCRNARRKYLSARKRYNVRPSSGNKAHLTNMSKSYKKILNFLFNDHKNKTQNKLRNLHSGQPKQFWKLMHNLETKKVDDKIKIEELYEYFKNLNSDELNDDNEPQIDLNDQNDTLDAPITEKEIRLNLKRLHNNKSPSDDRITNKFLNCMIDFMLPLYKDYFNTILDTGIMPDSWLKELICPIYKRSGNPSNPENYRPITLVSCFSKLFTSILNNRLNMYLEEFEICMKTRQVLDLVTLQLIMYLYYILCLKFFK